MIKKQALWLISGLACGFVLLGLVGCTQVIRPVTPSAQEEGATPVAAQTPRATRTFTLDSSALITKEGTVTIDAHAPNPQVLQAMKDLATRTSVALDDVEVVDFAYVVWPDGGLGCPQPGMLYPQVQLDGMLIHLRANGVTYEYHSGGNRPPFLCENPTPAKPQSATPKPNK